MTAFDKAWNVVKGLSPLEEAAADEYSTAEDYSPSKRRMMLEEMDPYDLGDALNHPHGDLDYRGYDPAAAAASGDARRDLIDTMGDDDVNEAYEQIMRLRELGLIAPDENP